MQGLLFPSYLYFRLPFETQLLWLPPPYPYSYPALPITGYTQHLEISMGIDPEKDDVGDSRPISQSLDDRVEHAGLSTLGDDELKKDEDEGSTHSQTSSTIEPAPAEQGPPSRSKSRSSSVRSHQLVVIPLSKRRGLLARLALIVPEVERPYDYKNSTKWFLTMIVALAAAAAPMGSAIFLREISPLSEKSVKR